MKKCLCLVVLFIVAFLLNGCTNLDSSKRHSEEILNYLTNKDADGLKNMFCEIIASSDDFDEQIQDAFDFFEGEVLPYDSIDDLMCAKGVSEKRRQGVITRFSIAPQLENVKTDAEKTYFIRFNVWIINTDYEDRIGISELYIRDENGDECVVGDFYLVNPEWQ